MGLLTALLTRDQEEKMSHPPALPRKESTVTGPQRHPARCGNGRLAAAPVRGTADITTRRTMTSYHFPTPGQPLALLLPPQAAGGSQGRAFSRIGFRDRAKSHGRAGKRSCSTTAAPPRARGTRRASLPKTHRTQTRQRQKPGPVLCWCRGGLTHQGPSALFLQ